MSAASYSSSGKLKHVSVKNAGKWKLEFSGESACCGQDDGVCLSIVTKKNKNISRPLLELGVIEILW